MATNIKQDTLNGLRWRCIGPPRGARSIAVAGDPASPAVFYFGACAGGVWKTYDGGTYWENVSDGFFKTSAVGAIAVAESDPNVVYVGMGEACVRVDGSYGDGVYRSTDAGKTWINVGLQDTRHISRVRVHPDNPDLVYVAALGHAFGPHPDRGVFRSTDGGETWDKVLTTSNEAGAIDLSMDPANPRRLYAAAWRMRRRFWDIESGGPGSGLYRSTDGGDTWVDVSQNPGFPAGPLGRIGVAVSPTMPGRVWATVEARERGLYRSDDDGESWELLTDNRDLQGRPWYYQHVFADPVDPDTVWVLNYKLWRSIDGGRNFEEISAPHGDHHDLWIDPRDPQRMIEGADGGACVSFNGGDTWSTIYNQLTAQFYRLDTDNRFPYNVYATQQDNSAISVPSGANDIAINWADCHSVGSSESGHIAVHPANPDVVFSGAIGSSPGGGGNLLRYDRGTGQTRIVTVWPEDYSGVGAKDMKHRFQWTFPILFSPHDSNTLYVAGERVFKSTDEGSSWTAISPDLSRNDHSKMQPSGGSITREATGGETYCVIQSLAESTLEKGHLWAGSDDGLVHLSRDGGASWQDVTPAQLKEWTLISAIEPSHHEPGKAYLAGTLYKFDDPRPILMRTSDYGASWVEITGGLPADEYSRVIREDHERPGLLYAGAELGIHVSFDDGGSWQPLQANLPITPVHDIKVKGNDLIAGTHGRSIWILDDLNVLRELAESAEGDTPYLFTPRRTHRLPGPILHDSPDPGKTYHQHGLGAASTYVMRKTRGGEEVRVFLDAGESPTNGAIVYYYLPEPAEVEVAFLDPAGEVIRSFTSADSDGARNRAPGSTVAAAPGLNRFVWDMLYPGAVSVPGDLATSGKPTSPHAPPGRYTVRLTVNGTELSQELEIAKDPRVAASQADLQEKFRLHTRIRDRLSEVNGAIIELRSVRQQVAEWASRSAAADSGAGAVARVSGRLIDDLDSAEKRLMKVGFRGALDRPNIPPTINSRLAELCEVVAAADFAPPRQAYDVFEELSRRGGDELAALRVTIDTGVGDLIRLLRENGVPMIATGISGEAG